MSILASLFRKRTLAELWAEAEALAAAGGHGEAKLAFDRLAARAEKEDPALAQRAQLRSNDACDAIAMARMKEAGELARAGHLDLAREELRHALETAQSEQVRGAVQAAITSMEQRDASKQAAIPPVELSDEERLTLISGSWEPLQAEELESHGEPMMQALLAIDDERGEDALALLLPMTERAREASYLWLEVARAQLLAKQLDASEQSLRRFVSRIGPDEGGTARLLAHRELARLLHERGDLEGAVRELEASAEALEDDPRPLLDLGNYLRLIGRATEAVEVLELCATLFEDGTVEWPVTLELGLACADAGQSERAIEALESVVQTLLGRGNQDVPAAAAVALAKLHEAGGNLVRAADLYRTLAQGEDRANHARYHREVARVLDLLGMADEARRMRERAEALGR